MRGKAYRSRLRHQFCPCHRPRQPPRNCSSTRRAASVTVGTALDPALVGQRVSAGPGELAVGEGQFARLRQRDERHGAESELATSAADNEPLDPASRAGGLDEYVQPVAVCVSSWRRGPDEGGSERLVGMASSALGSWGSGGEIDYNINPRIIYGIGLDIAICPDRLSPLRRIINDYK